MDVTRHNLVAMLPDIERAIRECDFAAIDTELSGLRKGRGGHLFDDHDERYVKIKDSSMAFAVIQVGLSCFKKNIDSGSYVCNSYNFYIFPYKVSGLAKHIERNFEVQASALQFLRNHGFDFNFLFENGINWLKMDEENEVKEVLERNLEKDDSNGNESEAKSKATFIIPEEHLPFVNEVNQKIETFFENSMEEKLDLSPSTAFQRKMIYESIKTSKFSGQLQVQTCLVSKTSREQYLSITRTNIEEKMKRNEQILAEALGMSKVIQFLIQYQKPLCGHNLMLDLLHIVNQFVSSVPATYSEFKELVQTIFPSLYDTKFIASTLDFKVLIPNSALGEMFQVLQKPPFIRIDVDLTRPDDSNESGKIEKLHQAGYDSYITGYCFLLMCEYLRKLYKSKEADGRVETNVIGSEMKRFENKLQLTYTFDLSHFNLGGSEVGLERNHVFFVSFPKDWTTRDITQLFSAFGYVSVGWLNDVSALVGLKDATKWKEAKKSFQKGPPSLKYRVSTYQEYLKKVKGIEGKIPLKRTKPSEGDGEEITDEVVTKVASKKNKVDSDEVTVNAEGDAAGKDLLFKESTDW